MLSRIRLTYHKRLFLGLVIYSWLLVGVVALFQYHREKQFRAEIFNTRLQALNEQIISHLDLTGSIEIPKNDINGLRISVIDYGGRVIYDNFLDTLPGSSHLDREEIARALSTGEGYAVRRHSESTGGTYFYSAKRGKNYIVRTAVPYSLPLNRILSANYGFLWFMIGAAVVMCVIGFFVTRKEGKHIRRLRDFAKKAEKGESIVDVDSFSRDELGDISNHIVMLYAKLQQTTAERDKEHRQAILAQQEKTRIKCQLTNNINHELKTPVAAMQVCLETLLTHKDMPSDKREEFLNRCYEANKRLQTLLVDVSTLTRIEDGAANICKEKIDASSVVLQICSEYEQAAKQKSIEIYNNVNSPILINGNVSILSSIFRNLMDNAIAYSQGTLIEINIEKDSLDSVSFSFADNGKGVDEQHLDKIFERFYRIDKGRSRQLGGTGLGLSIVKNAVIWHGGEIEVKNRKQGGLLFFFTLKKS